MSHPLAVAVSSPMPRMRSLGQEFRSRLALRVCELGPIRGTKGR